MYQRSNSTVSTTNPLANEGGLFSATLRSWTLPFCLGAGFLTALSAQAKDGATTEKATPKQSSSATPESSADELVSALVKFSAINSTSQKLPKETEENLVAIYYSVVKGRTASDLKDLFANQKAGEKSLPALLVDHYRRGLKDFDVTTSSAAIEKRTIARYRAALPASSGPVEEAALDLVITAYARGLHDGQAAMESQKALANRTRQSTKGGESSVKQEAESSIPSVTDVGVAGKAAFLVSKELPFCKTFYWQMKEWKEADIDGETWNQIVGPLEKMLSKIKQTENDLVNNSSTSSANPAQALSTEFKRVTKEVEEKLEKARQELKPAEQRAEWLFNVPSSRFRDDSKRFVDSPYMAKYGTPDVFLRRLVKEVTGQALGSDIKIVVMSTSPTAGPLFSAEPGKREVFAFEGKSVATYEMVVARLAAGTGALLKQLRDQVEGWGQKRERSGELNPAEYASAVAFQHVIIAHLVANYPEFSFDKGGGVLTDSAFRAEEGGEKFSHGRKVYDAVASQQGNSAKAFNYLITDQYLTKDMGEVLYPNGKEPDIGWKRSRRIDRLPDEIKSISGKAEALLNEIGAKLKSELPAVSNKGKVEVEAAKKHDEAIAAHTKAIESNPKDVAAYLNRGVVFAEQKKYEEAISDYTKAIELLPTAPMLYFQRGWALCEVKQFDRSIADYTKTVELAPRDFTAYHNRGIAFYGLKRFEESIADFTKSLEINPDYTAALYSRGCTLEVLKRYDEAIADLTKAIELNPKNVTAHLVRGHALVNQEKYDEAIADYTKAIELDPSNWGAYRFRGGVYHNVKKFDKALADHSKSIELHPKYWAGFINRASTFKELQQYEDAIRDYTKAIELAPKEPGPHRERGSVFLRLEKYNEAVADYTKAFDLGHSDAASYHSRGVAFHKLKKFDDAIKDFTKAIELSPKTREYHQGRGEAYLSLKKNVEAIADFSRAIQLDSGHVEAYKARAVAFSNLLKFHEAIKDYDRAIQLDPKNASTYCNRGHALSQQMRYREAIADYNKSISLDPGTFEAYRGRGIALSGLKRYQEALTDYKKVDELGQPDSLTYYYRGFALYSLRRYRVAIPEFTKSIELNPSSNAYFYRGLAYESLGNSKEAKRDLDKAKELLLLQSK
jgi:tetratricopeptide (TPR) repeat protein